MLNVVLSVLGTAAGALLEVIVFVLYYHSRHSGDTRRFLLILGIHAAAVFLFSSSVYLGTKLLKFSSPKNWLILGLSGCFIFPGMGFLFFLGVFVFMAVSPKEKGGAYSEYEKYITYDFEPEKKYMASDQLDEGIREELEVSPLVDVLGEDNPNARRGVMNVVDKLPKKDAIHLLKMAMSDKSVEVRYLVASELSKIEAEFNENVFMARKETERYPDLADPHLALANAYAEYYDSDLLDEYAALYYRDLAVQEYEKCLALGGENINILNYLGNLDLVSKKYDDAFRKFRKVIEGDPNNIYAHVGLIQAYYETHQIHRAITHAKNTAEKMPPTKGIMREIIHYWASS